MQGGHTLPTTLLLLRSFILPDCRSRRRYQPRHNDGVSPVYIFSLKIFEQLHLINFFDVIPGILYNRKKYISSDSCGNYNLIKRLYRYNAARQGCEI